MIEFAICDNEPLFSHKLETMVKNICTQHQIEHRITTFNDARKILTFCCKYHVIFLDIDMPDMDGIEAAEEINIAKENHDFPLIVFVSNMENMVFKALKQYPYIFLRKMFLDEELEECILNINLKVNNEHRIAYSIKEGRNKIIINLNQVFYLEKEKNYVKFVLEKEVYKERTTIDEKYKDIHPKGFIRPHIGFLVNPKFILEFQTNSIILTNGHTIPLSKKYRNTAENDFFDWLGRNDD